MAMPPSSNRPAMRTHAQPQNRGPADPRRPSQQQRTATRPKSSPLITPPARCLQTNYANGDSLLRLALNLQRVQARVAGMLLEKLPEYCGDAADGAGAIDHGRPAEGTSTPSLILGQLRWWDPRLRRWTLFLACMRPSETCTQTGRRVALCAAGIGSCLLGVGWAGNAR